MRDPKRVLKKILRDEDTAGLFEKIGEPLDEVVDLFRGVQTIRKVRDWLAASTGLDIAIAPAVFHQLLDIHEINVVETANRDLDLEVVKLKETRGSGDPVSVGHLNSALRELYRDLTGVRERITKEFPDRLLLAKEITADGLETVQDWIGTLKALNWNGVGYLLTGWKARPIEKKFLDAFPGAGAETRLREVLPRVETELALYRSCLELNEKWRVLNLDVLKILRTDALTPVTKNLEELGNGLWNIVYKGGRLSAAAELAGIDFQDIRTLFDNERITLGG